MSKYDPDPYRPHSHEPNPAPPSPDPTFELVQGDEQIEQISIQQLQQLSTTTLADCYIVSTGHGTSGPFTFSGVTLIDFLRAFVTEPYTQVEVISADGFGNRVMAEEMLNPEGGIQILLAYMIDGQPLTRNQGLVRMIVPSESDDALRQVKWIGKIRVR